MEEIIPPFTQKQLLLKIIWNNLIQIISFLLVVVLIIYRRNDIDENLARGIIIMMLVYAMIRIAVVYQEVKFEREIEKEKRKGKGDVETEAYDLYMG